MPVNRYLFTGGTVAGKHANLTVEEEKHQHAVPANRNTGYLVRIDRYGCIFGGKGRKDNAMVRKFYPVNCHVRAKFPEEIGRMDRSHIPFQKSIYLPFEFCNHKKILHFIGLFHIQQFPIERIIKKRRENC